MMKIMKNSRNLSWKLKHVTIFIDKRKTKEKIQSGEN